MVFDEEHKNKVSERIRMLIADALENKELSLSDYQELSKALVQVFPKLKTNEDLLDYIQDLSKELPFFKKLFIELKSQKQEETDKQKTDQAEKLIKEQKVDEVLATIA